MIPGKEALENLLLNQKFTIRSNSLIYEDVASCQTMLRGRAKISGESEDIVEARIQQAEVDQQMLVEIGYQKLFKDQVKVKMVKPNKFDEYLADLSKKFA